MPTSLLTFALLFVQCAVAAEPTTLRGTVRDDQGRPLEGVLVAAQVGYDSKARVSFTKSSPAGDFELPDIGDDATTSQVQYFALKHGWGAAYKRLLPRDKRPERLDFVLAPAKTETITLVDPQGKPVGDTDVEELTIIADERNAGHLFSNSLREFPFRSDAEGKIAIDIVPRDQYLALQVNTETWGRQRDLFNSERPDRVFKLRPVGSIEGQVTAPAGKSVEGIDIFVEVRVSDTRYFYSRAAATTDAEGKFRVAAVPAGQATVRIAYDQKRPVQPGPPVQVQVVASQTAKAELKLPKTVRVTGKVIDDKTDEPIAGAKVRAWNNAAGASPPAAETDKEGAYALEIAAGQIGVEVQEVPLPYYIGVRNTAGESTKEGQETLAAPPLRVPRGRRLEGTVVDEQGHPAPHAWVNASWWEEQKGLMTIGNRAALADQEGRFVVEPVSTKIEVYLRADTPDRAGTEFVTAPLDQKDPLRLTVSPAGIALIAGRVVDSQKKPIPGATVRVYAGQRQTSNRLHSAENMREWTLKTDAEGRFQLPEALPRHLPPPGKLASFSHDSGYSLTVTAAGRLQHQQYAKIGQDRSPFILPDIVLAREGRLVGRVIDRQGKPIAGVEVRAVGAGMDTRGFDQHQSAIATTAADGRYELKGIHPDALFVFAGHKDYAFSGAPLPANGGELTLTLATHSEAAADPPLGARLATPGENLAALQKLLLPLWDKLDPKEHFYQRAEIWKLVAPLDPQWARKTVPELWGLRHRIEAMRKLGHLDDALDAVAATTDAYERSSTLVRLADDTPDAARKRQLLAEAAIQAKTVIDPNRRLTGLALVAEALYKLQDRDAAKRIIDECLPEIEKLEPGFWRGHLAERVALFDVEKALQLCEGATDKYERDRHPGNIAHKLAASDPPRAEAIIGSLSAENQYRYVPAVCYRMAPVDLARARKVADSAHKTGRDQEYRAYARVVMAQAIYEKDAEAARVLLKEASELLADKRAASIYDRQPFGVGFALVHASERIDPAATREYFWRAVSLARGVAFRVNRDSELDSQFQADAELAILLQRYDQLPEIAARLVEPIYTCDKLPLQRFYQHVATIGMAMVDLDRAIDWIERYRAEAKGDQLRYIPQPWELMAAAVGGDEATFWKTMCKKVFYLPLPDEED